MNDDLRITLGLIIALIMGAYVYYSRRRVVLPDESGVVTLRPTILPLVGGLICVAIYAFSVLRPLLNTIGSMSGAVLFGVFLLPLLVIGVMNIRHFFNHRLSFDNQYVSITKWNGKTTRITWTEIKDISRGFALPFLTPYFIRLETDVYPHNVDFLMSGIKNFEVYLKTNNPDQGLVLKWRMYHNPDAGNGQV